MAASTGLIEELIDRVRPEHDDWKHFCSLRGVDVSYRDLPAESSGHFIFVRCTINVKVPLNEAVAVLRPESFFEGPCFLARIAGEAQLLRRFGVGDVLGCGRIHDSNRWRWVPFKARGPKQSSDLSGCFRALVRRDVPAAGDATIVFIPVDTERCELRERVGPHKAKVIMLQPLAGGQATRVMAATQVLHRLRWILPMVAATFVFKGFEAFMAAQHLEAADSWGGVVVVRIHKCVRGPPLLPLTWPVDGFDEACWSPCLDEGEDFHLATYLRRLLQVLGMPAVEIFSALDGRQLMFFDAALRRDTWKQVGELVEQVFGLQRQVYRKKWGGAHAPGLQVDIKPRFCGAEGPRQSGDIVAADTSGVKPDNDDEEESWPWYMAPVKNTFIDFPANSVDSDLLSLPLSQP